MTDDDLIPAYNTFAEIRPLDDNFEAKLFSISGLVFTIESNKEEDLVIHRLLDDGTRVHLLTFKKDDQ